MSSPIETFQAPGHMLMPMKDVGELVERCVEFSGERTSVTARMANMGDVVLRPCFVPDVPDDAEAFPFDIRKDTEAFPAEISIDVYPRASVVIGLIFNETFANRVGRPLHRLKNGDIAGDFGDADSVEMGFQRLEAKVGIADGVTTLSAKKVGRESRLLTGVTHEEASVFTSACAGAFWFRRFKEKIDMGPAPHIDNLE